MKIANDMKDLFNFFIVIILLCIGLLFGYCCGALRYTERLVKQDNEIDNLNSDIEEMKSQIEQQTDLINAYELQLQVYEDIHGCL